MTDLRAKEGDRELAAYQFGAERIAKWEAAIVRLQQQHEQLQQRTAHLQRQNEQIKQEIAALQHVAQSLLVWAKLNR